MSVPQYILDFVQQSSHTTGGIEITLANCLLVRVNPHPVDLRRFRVFVEDTSLGCIAYLGIKSAEARQKARVLFPTAHLWSGFWALIEASGIKSGNGDAEADPLADAIAEILRQTLAIPQGD